MAESPSRKKLMFYRRLYILALIDQGTNTVPQIIRASGMHRRTVQDAIKAIPDMTVTLDNNRGTFAVKDWGCINPKWIYLHENQIAQAVEAENDQ